jgi:hypothetical protein
MRLALGGGLVVAVGLGIIGDTEGVEPRHGEERMVGSTGVKPMLDIFRLL